MYKNILVPVDLDHGDMGEQTLLLARHIGGPDARITLLAVTEPVSGALMSHVPREALEAHDKDLRVRLQALAHEADDAATVMVRHGNPAETILDEAGIMSADAIVLGPHKPKLRNLLGSTAARVARHASCSVVIDRTSL